MSIKEIGGYNYRDFKKKLIEKIMYQNIFQILNMGFGVLICHEYKTSLETRG